MTKVSRFPLSSEKLSALINNLWSGFVLMDNKEDMRLLFKDLFTRTEYKMFAKRFEIARQLLAGSSYEDIQKNLIVTPNTIAAVNNILETTGLGYRKANEKLKSIEHVRQRKAEKRQALLERRIRPKQPGETLLFDLALVGARQINKVVKSKIKKNSARINLEL